MKDKKGFTLIELLAVIVILGVLLAIAVPAVTKYISSSRKSTFITNVKQYTDSARSEALDGAYLFPVNTNDATVIRFSTIYPLLEKGGKTSPYDGQWENSNCFVAIINDGTAESPHYVYYVAARDSKGYGLGSSDNGNVAVAIEYNELKNNQVIQLASGFSYTPSKADGSIIADTITINNETINVTRAY